MAHVVAARLLLVRRTTALQLWLLHLWLLLLLLRIL
jgi:hypothetical protein